MKRIAFLLLLLATVACASSADPTPTLFVLPTLVPTPSDTFTPRPTRTPAPTRTATLTLVPSETPLPTNTPLPKPTDTPVSPEGLLRAAIVEVLGDSNRDVPRVNRFQYDPGAQLLVIEVAINDNFGSDLILYGAKSDILDILEQIHLSSLDVQEVGIHETFALIDNFGNESEGVVLNVSYVRDVIDRINYENAYMIVDTILELGTLYYIHPDFE